MFTKSKIKSVYILHHIYIIIIILKLEILCQLFCYDKKQKSHFKAAEMTEIITNRKYVYKQILYSQNYGFEG